MSKPQAYQKNKLADVQNKRNTTEEHSLKGTFASVMIVGLFLALSWLGVFLLFMFRN